MCSNCDVFKMPFNQPIMSLRYPEMCQCVLTAALLHRGVQMRPFFSFFVVSYVTVVRVWCHWHRRTTLEMASLQRKMVGMRKDTTASLSERLGSVSARVKWTEDGGFSSLALPTRCSHWWSIHNLKCAVFQVALHLCSWWQSACSF